MYDGNLEYSVMGVQIDSSYVSCIVVQVYKKHGR
jgi:hypothetical protein